MAEARADNGGGGGEEEELEHLWDALMVKLVALRGDPEVEAFITDKHEELLTCAVPLDASSGRPRDAPDGTTMQEAREAWFRRKLRGSSSGDPKERRKLTKGLSKALRKFAEKYERPAGTEGAFSAAEVLKEGGWLEGPVICHQLAAGLVGTGFEGLYIAKQRRSVYQLGAKLLVAVQADLEGGQLLVHGYFDDSGSLNSVRIPVRAFLEEHLPQPAEDDCDIFTGAAATAGAPGVSAAEGDGGEKDAKRPRELPPGWTKRESRSKPGVYYYVHEAKGLSQFERPES